MGGEGLAAFAATRTLCASWFCWRPCPFGRAAVRNGQDRRQQRNKQRSRFATFRGSVRQEHRSRLELEKRSKRRTRDRVRYAVALWLVLVFPVSQAKWQPSDDPYARFFGPDPKRVAQEESVAGGPCGTTYVMLPSLLGGVRGGGRKGGAALLPSRKNTPVGIGTRFSPERNTTEPSRANSHNTKRELACAFP